MKARHKRIAGVLLGLSGLATAVGLALSAFNENLVFFFSPSQVVTGEAPVARSFRIGGLVEAGSLRRGADGLTAYFTITDTVHRVPVSSARTNRSPIRGRSSRSICGAKFVSK